MNWQLSVSKDLCIEGSSVNDNSFEGTYLCLIFSGIQHLKTFLINLGHSI